MSIVTRQVHSKRRYIYSHCMYTRDITPVVDRLYAQQMSWIYMYNILVTPKIIMAVQRQKAKVLLLGFPLSCTFA